MIWEAEGSVPVSSFSVDIQTVLLRPVQSWASEWAGLLGQRPCVDPRGGLGTAEPGKVGGSPMLDPEFWCDGQSPGNRITQLPLDHQDRARVSGEAGSVFLPFSRT